MEATAYLHSAFGWWEIRGTERGLTRVRHLNAPPPPRVEPPPDFLRLALRQLDEYFAGTRTTFDLPLDLAAHSEFQRGVWRELLTIPYGRTTSYGAIATRLGDANAMRAVGLANRNNPIAIIVPCHRCIAKNGDLQGYFYGLDFKRRLLALENPASFAEQGVLFG